MNSKTSRADKAITELRNEALDYFTRYLPEEARERSRCVVEDLIERYGPVVESYPHWHPLVNSSERNPTFPETTPNNGRCGYRGLDHTRLLRNAIITCPYSSDKEVFESVRALRPCRFAGIAAEPIEVPLYHPNAKPVLITCEWDGELATDGTIPASFAVPLLLEIELPNWRRWEVAETWETMRGYFLGFPRNNRSSVFINEKTGRTLKSVWNALINTGMFGPVMVG